MSRYPFTSSVSWGLIGVDCKKGGNSLERLVVVAPDLHPKIGPSRGFGGVSNLMHVNGYNHSHLSLKGVIVEVLRNVTGAPKPVGPYSPAAVVGDIVFCAGQIGLDPETNKMVSGGIVPETQRVLANLDAVLSGAGSCRDKVAMTTIFLADLADGPKVNEIYGGWVSSEFPPARQTVAVKALPLGALVEISVIAAK